MRSGCRDSPQPFFHTHNKKAPRYPVKLSGAVNQIRTGDLVLTKDVLYRLSHNSNLVSVS